MKATSEIHIEDDFRSRKSSIRRGFGGGLSSKTSYSSRISQEEAEDTRKVKKVRFTVPDTVYQHNCKPDASSIASKRTQTKTFDDPKTSEYSFFKRLREGTGRNNHFHNQDRQSEKVEATNFSEADQLAKYRCEEVRPLSVRITPIKLRSPLCSGEASKNQGSVTNSSNILEPYNSHQKFFSGKRQKLRQWVAKALLLDVDEISSKGYDVVSMLLQRLVPQSNGNERCMPLSSRYEGLCTRSQLIASSDSKRHFEELPRTPASCRHFIEPTSWENLDDDTSECESTKSRVVPSLQWDTANFETLSTRNTDIFGSQLEVLDTNSLSTGNSDIFGSQYRKILPYCPSDDEKAAVLHTKMRPCWFPDLDRDPPKRNGSLPHDQVPKSSDSDCHFEALAWTPTPSMHFIEPMSRQHMVDDTLECWSNKSGVVTSSQWDTANFEALTTKNADIFDSQWEILDSSPLSNKNANVFDLRYRDMQPYSDSDDENAALLQTKMKPCWFPDVDGESPKRNGSLLQDRLPIFSKSEYASRNNFSLWDSPDKSFGSSDEFYKKNDLVLGIEHLTKFLDQSYGNSFSSMVIASPIRPIALRDEEGEQRLSKYDANELDSLAFPAIHHSASMTSLLDFWSKRYHYQTFGRSFEENDRSATMMHSLPLTLSCYQSCLPQGCRLLENYRGTDFFNHPHAQHSFTSQVLSKKLCPNVGSLVPPSRLDSDFRWKSLLVNDSLAEHPSICPDYKFNAKQTKNLIFPILTMEQSMWSMDDSSGNEMQSQQSEEIFSVHDYHS